VIDRTIYWALSPGLTGHPRVLNRFWKLTAVIGLALTALSLAGSSEKPPTLSLSIAPPLAEAIRRGNAAGKKRYSAGKYLEARALFLATASLAEQGGDLRSAAMYWNNAGAAAVTRLDYRDAQLDYLKARKAAQTSRELVPLAATTNNLASLYLQMGNPEAAIHIAREALAGPVGTADRRIHPKLEFQLASALARMRRFDEADGIYKAAIDELDEQGDFDSAARALASLGSAALEANRLDEAETALSKALLLVRIHRLTASANVLRGLAQVKSRRGDLRSAVSLFNAAIAEPQSLTPRWVILADRARFRLDHDDLRGALADFREAHRLAALMRADIVPADQDRITFESGLNRVGAGLVDAGNRLAQQTSDRALLKETFDIAEEDRLWSLRALVPASNDWRTRLPANYWDLLAGYQSVERGLMAQPSAEMQKRASGLQLELQEIEASAAPGSKPAYAQSALAHVRSVLGADSVLFSFHVTKSAGWLWAVDRGRIDVYPVPALEILKSRVTEFALATRGGETRAVGLGSRLYKDLFGAVPAAYLAHKRWLLELDGPLFDLPFASLVVPGNAGIRKNEPIYLIERAALQAIPGALMLEPLKQGDPRAASTNGGFLGIGDPVYNAADNRYKGDGNKKPAMVLPRLPATAEELQACSRAWGAAGSRILTGRDADLASVWTAIASHPSVIHFATHVVASPQDHSSGLIALSLDRSGAMGLMGPTEIVAHPVSAGLVVLNGCHSGQGDELPDAGLMGLTRAWIGAGAASVLATRWDIPDEAGKTVMVEFYRALRAHPERGAAFALEQAQLAALKENDLKTSRSNAAIWAAYFLLGRE